MGLKLRAFRRGLVAAIAVAFGAVTASAQPPASLMPARPAAHAGAAAPEAPAAATARLTREDLDAWLDGFLPFSLERGGVAGAVVVVVKDGQVLFQKGYGYADVAARTPVDPERTLFRPGSVSKLFTWTALMQLVEQGRVGLDQDVNTYLDFKVPPFHGRPVTLRNLMTHTPGFDEVGKDVVAFGPSVPPLGAFLKRALPKRVYPAGETPAYSNYGAALAGYIIERVSHQSFDAYVEQHIFAPLGMRRSTFRQPSPEDLRTQTAKAYIDASEPPKPYEMVALAPAGSLAATGSDMARFMLAHLQDGASGGGRILQPATAQLMHGLAYPAVSPNLNSMLLGFMQINRNGRRIIGHMGDTEAFHSYLFLYPDDHVGVFASFDGRGRDAAVGPIRGALFDRFADRYFPAPPAAPATRLDAATARRDGARLAGQYDVTRRSQSSFFSLTTLLGQTAVAVDKDGLLTAAALKTYAGQPKRFEEVAPMLWREVGGQERLAAKIVDGKVALWAEDEFSPFEAFQPTPAWRDAAWLLPLLMLSVAAGLATLLLWPVTAWARARYGAAFALEGRERVSYRLVRLLPGGAALVMAAWLATIVQMLQGGLSGALDPWILTLHVLTVLLFPAAAVAAAWNVGVVWRGRHGWASSFARLWALVLLAASLVLLWVGLVFHLVGFGLSY